jgi:hypothetical protein
MRYLWNVTKAMLMLCLFLFLQIKFMCSFIGREKARAYLQCIYCKVKQWIQRELSHTIKSRCACVWMYGGYIYGGYPNSTLLLENLSLFETWKHLLESRGYLIHLSLFLGGHLSTHCFQYLRHFHVHFFNSFFLFFFIIFLWITFA